MEAYQEDQSCNKGAGQRGKKWGKGDGFEKTKREGRCHEGQGSQGPEESDEDYHPTLDTETQDENLGMEPLLGASTIASEVDRPRRATEKKKQSE